MASRSFHSVFGQLDHLPVADSCLFSLGQSHKFLLAESFLSSIALRNIMSVSFWRTTMKQKPSTSFLADTWRRSFLVCTKGRGCTEANTEMPGYTWALSLPLSLTVWPWRIQVTSLPKFPCLKKFYFHWNLGVRHPCLSTFHIACSHHFQDRPQREKGGKHQILFNSPQWGNASHRLKGMGVRPGKMTNSGGTPLFFPIQLSHRMVAIACITVFSNF